MDQDLGHAERVGDQTCMLAPGAAEAIERIARHVVAALHRDFLDGVRHVLDRDLDEPVGHLFGRAAVADLARQFDERRAHGLGVERLVLAGPEDLRKKFRDQLAGHDIGVGERQRPAAAVALRAGIGAGRIRPDPESRAVEMQDRAAARRNRVDQHHGRAHAHAGDLGLEGALVLAVEMADVGRSAAHVEADQPRESRGAAGLRHADHAAGRARQDGVLALEQIRGREPAGRHHEHETRTGALAVEFVCDLRHVAGDDRGEIGVHHTGVAPRSGR